MLSEDIRLSAGRVEGKNGRYIGSCALVAPDLVATCAHVVADALGIDRTTSTPPGEPLTVCFPAAANRFSLARIEHWTPFDPALSSGSDLALLRLDTPPPGAGLTPPVGRADTLTAGREVGTVCWDSPFIEGETRLGKVVDDSGPFLTIHGTGYGAKGMSGAGVWSTDGVLLGLFSGVPSGSSQTSAYAIPANAIIDALSRLGTKAGRSQGLFEPYPRPLHPVFGPAALLDARYGIAPLSR